MSTTRSGWTRASAVAGMVALAATGLVASLALTGPAEAGPDGDRWRGGFPAATDGTAASPERALEPRQTLRIHARQLRGRDVDVDGDGRFEPGDYFVFVERLSQGGEHVGRAGAECMAVMRVFACEASLHLKQRGKIEVSGGLFSPRGDTVLAVTGGTGGFDDASGTFTVLERPGNREVLVIELN